MAATTYYQKDNVRQDRPCVIFVEGDDDAFFVSALLEELGVDTAEVGIVVVGGNNNFATKVKLFLKSARITQQLTTSIAVICDADDNHQAIEDIINQAIAELQIPRLLSGQHIVTARGLKIG